MHGRACVFMQQQIDGLMMLIHDRQTDRQLQRSDDLTIEGDCEGIDGHGGKSSVPQTDNQTSS